MLGILALNSVVTGSEWDPGALVLLLGTILVGELGINCLDGLLDSLNSAVLGFFAWNEGVSLLGCVPEKGF